MSDTTESLRRKISSASDLRSVVRTMKALAASNIGQYEKSVRALADYYRSVELGLEACFRAYEPVATMTQRKAPTPTGVIRAIVFGSDQGLVGQFNDVVVDYAFKTLAPLPGKCHVWAVGERVHRVWRTRACRPLDSSRCPTRSRPSRRSSGRFKLKVKHIGTKARMRLYGCSIINRWLEHCTNRLARDCCRSMPNGNKGSPKFIGRLRACPRSWAVAL